MANWEWDEILLACDLVARNNWKELRPAAREVIELSEFLRGQVSGEMLQTDPEYRNVNGVSRKTTDIMTAHPDYPGAQTKGGRTTAEVVAAYLSDPDQYRQAAVELRQAERLGRDVMDAVGAPAEDDADSIEGRVIHRLVRTRERDPKLRARKIKQALSQRGNLACEVCAFDFEQTFGDLGAGYAHIHHVVPLHASGEVKTALADLAVVCANCHVMLHRGQQWKTPGQLRQLIQLRSEPSLPTSAT